MTKAKLYSSEFKREAILRAGEEGITDRAVCDELGISRMVSTVKSALAAP
jgi:transposase-like protein